MTAAVPREWIEGAPCRVPDAAAHELFLRQAQRAPDALAVRQWGRRLSYRQLADLATALARQLRASGVGPGVRAGVCLRRTPWLPASELAVLIAGGTFVPLDLDQPAQRLRAIVEDAGIEIAVTDSAGASRLAGIVPRLVPASSAETGSAAAAGTPAPEFERVSLADTAYIMYTSGSTGRPKGVMIGHGNLAAFAAAANQCFGDSGDYRLGAFAASGFDISIYDFFTPLVRGASIQLVSEAERADAGALQRFLEAHRVTRALLPPVLLPLLDPERLPSLSEILVGGEPCDPGQVSRWAAAGLRRFFNWYGPTEATVAVVGTELSGHWDTPLPIGRPLPGSRIYVLDGDLGLCAPGQVGELFIGGPQVSQGYLGRPRENAERFVPERIPGMPHGGSGVLYRTGDLARWDETGMIAFLGRADRQVQIHGQRAEPGEIEAVLGGHPRVGQAVIDVADGLVRAYVTPGNAPPAEELRAYCAARLPGHMVPVRVTALERIPVTVNAKVDFAALRALGPEPATAGTAGPDRPANEFEQAVAHGWADVFEGTRPGRADDFFLAGGDSLAAMKLVAALRQATGRDVSVADVFAGRTMSGIAERVSAADAVTGTGLPTGSAAVLSPAQQRLWFVEQFAPGVPVHNIVIAAQVSGGLDVPVLEHALGVVASRQAALRWRLAAGDGLPAVTVAGPEPVRIDVTDLPGADLPAVRARLDQDVRTPLPLTGDPLWRVRLLRLAEDEHVLVITVHHIVFDGWSQSVLYRELSQAYQELLDGGPASERPRAVEFADYAAWTLDQARRRGQTDADWWERHLAGVPRVLELPRDRPRPPVVTFSGEIRRALVPAGLAAEVVRLAAAEVTTPGAVMLAAFSILVARLTGQRDQLIGIPLADRDHAEFEDLIGYFVRTLPLRLQVDDNAGFAQHVRACGAELAAARQHADAPLERIIEALGGRRDLNRNPLFQVMFNVYNFAEARLELGATTVRPLQAGVPGSLVDLTMYVVQQNGGMQLEVAYNCDLYDGDRIEALLASYTWLLAELVREPARNVAAASARPAGAALPDPAAVLPAAVADGPGLLEQIREIARLEPDAVAVRDAGRVLTYRDLLLATDQVAATVRSAGVQIGETVAVLAGRTALLPAALLGVLAAGARWAVTDGGLPAAALARRLEALQPRALIRCGSDASVPPLSDPVVVLDISQAMAGDAGPSAADVPASRRGYLSLTSGTTGEPKIIETGEAPLTHFLNWYRAGFGIGRDCRVPLLSGLEHDPLLRDMCTPLACGGTLVVPDSGLLRDPSALLAWLADEAVTVAHLTPQLVRLASAAAESSPKLTALRLIAVGGDQLTESDAAELRRLAPRARLLNFYGTTETPQAQAVSEIPGPDQRPGPEALAARRTTPLPVGAGIDGAQLIVLSGSGQPAAVGELGEVLIRSRYLSRGYAADPELTARRFAPLPGAGEGGVFRTGDLGRHGPGGAVTLAGRADDQVKVRGFRVELGEVEAALAAHPDVRSAAVTRLDRDGAPALHGYAVAANRGLTEPELLRHLRSLLPQYAVPAGITFLSELPLTNAGKTDRARLPAPRPEARPVAAESDVPTGRLEREILAIWRDVLGMAHAGSTDNFFEIGGHSMAVIEVQSRLKRSLGRQVAVVDLFRFPTIRSLAGHLAGDEADAHLLAAEQRGRLRRQRTAGRQRAGHPAGPG